MNDPPTGFVKVLTNLHQPSCPIRGHKPSPGRLQREGIAPYGTLA